MRHVALLAALVLVVCLSATAPLTAASAPSSSPVAPAEQPGPERRALAPADGPLSLTVGTPQTNFTVSLREDGSARWTVETRIPLEDEADRSAFSEYAEAYEAGEAAGGPQVGTFRNAVESASEATGREMSIRAVNRTASLANDSGVLRLRFTWTDFLAETDSGELVLGDAFRTPDNGTWFGSLSSGQRLVIEPPEGYEVSDVSQGFTYSISDRRIVAEGPQQFDAGDIEVTYAPGAAEPQGFPLTPLAAGAGVVILLAAAYLLYRLRDLRPGGAGAVESDPATEESSASVDGEVGTVADAGDAAGTPAGARDGAAVSAGGDTDPAVVGEADANGGPEPDEDLELLSDEERVERLLAERGGRMRQANIVSETGWSDAKVSQLLSAMAEAGRVEKLRLGRENLISLAEGAEVEVDDADRTEGDSGDEGLGDGSVPR